MPNFDGASINGLLSTPLVLPASVAGALVALFVVLTVLALRRAGAGGIQRLLMPIATLVLAALAVIAVVDRLAMDERAAERRAMLQRHTELTARAIAPGSILPCLDGGAGETVENSCEKAVFATPQSAAAAVAYTGARLSLLADASEFAHISDPGLLESFAAARRSIELDRYGIAAHVLANRDGCTPERCAGFALVNDTGTLKANMRVHAFDKYVARYADGWNRTEPPAAPPPVASAIESPAPAKGAVSSRYDFPSAASIPPVSIMDAEPPLPKDPAGNTAAPPAGENAAPAAKPPVPPKRPQNQAAAPPAR